MTPAPHVLKQDQVCAFHNEMEKKIDKIDTIYTLVITNSLLLGGKIILSFDWLKDALASLP